MSALQSKDAAKGAAHRASFWQENGSSAASVEFRCTRHRTTQAEDARPRPPRRARFVWTSEKPFQNDERIARFNEIAELRVEFPLVAIDQSHDFDSGGRSAVGDAASERQRLQHRVATLDS